MGLVINRTMQTSSTTAMATQMINDLVSAGLFTLIWSNTGNIATATQATLEATSVIDPVAATYPWRIQIDAVTTAGSLFCYYGGPFQLPSSGAHTAAIQTTLADGTMLSASYLCDFDIYATNHGVLLYVKATLQPTGYYGFTLIQRPVNKDTGAVLTTKRAPVFVLNAKPAASPIYCSEAVARESDGTAPTALRDFTSMASLTHTNIIPFNAAYAPPILDADGNFLIFPIGGIKGSQGIYLEELDMVMWANGNGFNNNQVVSISAYGGTRQYTTSQIRGASQDIRWLFFSGGTGF